MVGQRTLDPFILVRIQARQHFGKLSASAIMNTQSTPSTQRDWFVYLLLCDQKTFYVGITMNLVTRIYQHRHKQSVFTSKFSDFSLVYCEKYAARNEATKREQQLKRWTHAKKQFLIDGKFGINTCTEFAEALLAKRQTL